MDAKIQEKFHAGELYDAYKYMGCVFDEKAKSAVFRVFAPNAKRVSVTGDFNGWNENAHIMERLANGIFEVRIEKVKRYDAYKFCIKQKNGKTRYKTDPYMLHGETSGGTNSKVYPLTALRVSDAYYIEKQAQKDIYNSPMLIYELHIGSWKKHADGNVYSYRKLADELVPYLRGYGYTHVELMGVLEHPFDGSWGYQVTGYFAPTSRYGTPADFCYLVQKLHAAGIGVIVDWVPGHFPKDAAGLIEFDGKTLYEPSSELKKEHKEWGTRCFDYGRGEVQTFLCSSAMMWFDLYHIDGLRVDAVASMLYLDYGRKSGEWERNEHGGSENIQAVAFLQKLNTAIFQRFPKALMIAEESTAWARVTRPVDEGGLGFNFKWNMGWMNDALDYFKTDPLYRGGKHDKLTFSLTYAFSENYVLPVSHDEVVHGKASLLNKMPGEYEQKFSGLRNFMMYMYAHPGKKLTFMGTEFGQFSEWDYKKQLDFMLLDFSAHQVASCFFKSLNAVFKKYKPFWQIDDSFSGFLWNVVDDKSQNILIFSRVDKDLRCVTFVGNFSNVDYFGYRFGALKGSYKTILHSDTKGFSVSGARYKTVKEKNHGYPDTLVLDIPANSGLYLYKSARRKNHEEVKNEQTVSTKS